jgi:hypothetical protein
MDGIVLRFVPTLSGRYVVSVRQIPVASGVSTSPLALQVLSQPYACAGQSTATFWDVADQQQVNEVVSVPLLLSDCFGNIISREEYKAADFYPVDTIPSGLHISVEGAGTLMTRMVLFTRSRRYCLPNLCCYRSKSIDGR